MNDIEGAVMKMLLEGDHPVLVELRRQLEAAVVSKRENTGVGFFTDFAVPPERSRIDKRTRFTIGDVYAEIEGLKHGVGFVLFVDGGAIDFLEAFCMDEKWPAEQKISRTYYVRPVEGHSGSLAETSLRDLQWALKDAE